MSLQTSIPPAIRPFLDERVEIIEKKEDILKHKNGQKDGKDV
jgi:hypothetical protein